MVENQHLVNIAKAIEKGTRVTTLDELKAKGQNQVKVINAAKIMELIREAVDLAVDSMTGQKVGAEKEKLQALAKKEFDELFRKYQEQQKSKDEIEGQAGKMQAEIDAVQNLLKGGMGGSAEAQMGLAGLSGQIAQLVQKLQTSEKARIESAVHQKRIDGELAELKKKYAELEQQNAAAVGTGKAVAGAVDAAYAKVDAGLGAKAREMGLDLGPEPQTPEQKMERLAKIADAAVTGLEKEKAEKSEAKKALAETTAKKAEAERELATTRESRKTLEGKVEEQGKQIQQTKDQLAATEAKKANLEREHAVLQDFKKSLESKSSDQQQMLAQTQQKLAQTEQKLAQTEQKLAQTENAKRTVEQALVQTDARKATAEKELGELHEFKKKLEEKVDEQGEQYAEVHQMMAAIGKRADDLIHEVESGRLKHLKPEEKKIIVDAMQDLKENLKKLQDERSFLEKKLFYMSMTIDSLETELLAAKGLTPSVGGSAHLKDDGLAIVFDEAGMLQL